MCYTFGTVFKRAGTSGSMGGYTVTPWFFRFFSTGLNRIHGAMACTAKPQEGKAALLEGAMAPNGRPGEGVGSSRRSLCFDANHQSKSVRLGKKGHSVLSFSMLCMCIYIYIYMYK